MHRSKTVRFLVLALTLLLMVGGASAKVDGFEDGDYTNNPKWSLTETGGSASVQSSTVIKVTEALELSTSGSGSIEIQHSTGGLSVSGNDKLQFWIRTSTQTSSNFALTNTDGSQTGNDAIEIGFNGVGNFDMFTYDSSGSFITGGDIFTGYSTGKWYRIELDIDTSSNEVTATAYDSNGNQLGKKTNSYSGAKTYDYILIKRFDNANGQTYADDITYVFNSAPSFNSKSVTPDPPEIGNDVSYSADVTDTEDSDSNLDTTLTLYDDSTQVYQATKTGSNPSWSDIYQATEGSLDARFNVTDSNGATTTEWLNKSLSDDAPSVSLNTPTGTKLQFSQSFSVDVNDNGDDHPNEDLTCDLELDNSQFDSRTVSEGSSYTVSKDADLGSHSADVTCTETDDNQQDSGSTSFTVKSLKFNSVSSDSNTFETLEESFSSTQDVGGMVNKVKYSLNYSDSIVSTKSESYSSKTLGDSKNIFHDIPLVSSDGTSKDWRIQALVNYTKLGGSTTTKTKNSSINTQTVDQAYKFGNHSLEEGFTQLEASVLNYTATVEKKSSNARGQITGKTNYKQTGTEKQLTQGNGLNFSNTFSSELINSSQETFNLDTTFNLSFNGDYRTFDSSKTVTLDKLRLNSNSNGAETLRFETQDEVNKTDVKSNVEMGLQVFNPDQPNNQRFYGFDLEDSSKHSIYLQPSYAEAKVNAFENETIAYQNSSENYPKRRHFLIDEHIDNQTTVVDLFMLKEKEASNVIIELKDSDLQELEQHIVRIERDFPSQDDTTTVAMVKTGSQGEANVRLDPDEQYIFTVFDENGELLDQIGPQSITQLRVELEVDDEIPEGFETVINDVRFTNIVEENDKLTVDYISETERLNNVSLTVEENNLFANKTIDVDSSTDLQGQLQVSGFNASNQSLYYKLEGRFGESSFVLNSGQFGTNTTDYGSTGIFMSALFFLALTLSGVVRTPTATVALGLLSVLTSAFIGFLPLYQNALISVAALATVLVWRMS